MPNGIGPKSIFNPHQQGASLSGLDTFMPQPGESFSSMPEDLIDGKVEEDEEEADVESGLDGSANSGDEAVEEIAEALDESRHAEPAKPAPPPPGDLH